MLIDPNVVPLPDDIRAMLKSASLVVSLTKDASVSRPPVPKGGVRFAALYPNARSLYRARDTAVVLCSPEDHEALMVPLGRFKGGVVVVSGVGQAKVTARHIPQMREDGPPAKPAGQPVKPGGSVQPIKGDGAPVEPETPEPPKPPAKTPKDKGKDSKGKD